MLPLPKRELKHKMTIFRLKLHFFRRNSATKFLCVTIDLSLCAKKWLVEDVPFYVKICPEMTHPLEKHRFLINIHS